MIDNPFRAQLARVSPPLIRLYVRLRLTPNCITICALLGALGASYCVAQGYFYWALLGWWLSRLLDGTDGILARATNQDTAFGAYLDIVGDMAAYSAMILGFAIIFPNHHPLWNVVLFLYVLCITSALALGSLEAKTDQAQRDNRGLRLGAGLAEGGETGIAYTVFLLFPDFISVTGWAWVMVLAITVASRTLLASQHLVNSNRSEKSPKTQENSY